MSMFTSGSSMRFSPPVSPLASSKREGSAAYRLENPLEFEMKEMPSSNLGFTPPPAEPDTQEQLKNLLSLSVVEKIGFLETHLSLENKLEFLRSLDSYSPSWRTSSVRKICGGKASPSSIELGKKLRQVQDKSEFSMDFSRPATCQFTQEKILKLEECWHSLRLYMEDAANGPEREEGKKARALYRKIAKKCDAYFKPEKVKLLDSFSKKVLSGMSVASTALLATPAFPVGIIGLTSVGLVLARGTPWASYLGNTPVSGYELGNTFQDLQKLSHLTYEELENFVSQIVKEYCEQKEESLVSPTAPSSETMLGDLILFIEPENSAKTHVDMCYKKNRLITKVSSYLLGKDKIGNTANNGRKLFLIIAEHLRTLTPGVGVART